MYTLTGCLVILLIISGAIVIIFMVTLSKYKGMVKRREADLHNQFTELNLKYCNLDYEFKEYKESAAIYAKAQDRIISQWEGAFQSAKGRVKELECDLEKEEKVADIFEEVIHWFMDSVDKNQASKAMTYVKCLKAIEESRKIDLQNQKPDGTTNRADSHLFSPSEAPGKPL